MNYVNLRPPLILDWKVDAQSFRSLMK